MKNVSFCGLICIILGLCATMPLRAEDVVTPVDPVVAKFAEVDAVRDKRDFKEACKMYEAIIGMPGTTEAQRIQCIDCILDCMVRDTYGTQPDMDILKTIDRREVLLKSVTLKPDRLAQTRVRWSASLGWLKGDWEFAGPYLEIEWKTTPADDLYKLWSGTRYATYLQLVGKKKEAMAIYQETLLDSAEVMSSGCAIGIWKWVSVNGPRMLPLDEYAEYLRQLDAIYSAKIGQEWMPFVESLRNARNGVVE